MKHISSDEAIQLKDKLDSLQRRYNELTARGADMLKHAQEALPLVQQFHNSHHRLVDWMLGAEAILQAAEPREEEISRLEADIQVCGWNSTWADGFFDGVGFESLWAENLRLETKIWKLISIYILMTGLAIRSKVNI